MTIPIDRYTSDGVREAVQRLLVGSGAVGYAAAAAQARADADAAWRGLSLSTDHGEVAAAAVDPLGDIAPEPSHPGRA